jgi:hypothetical protein
MQEPFSCLAFSIIITINFYLGLAATDAFSSQTLGNNQNFD